jgi:hypothetical protein
MSGKIEAYFDAWMAALDEMRRPDWRELYDRTMRDIAAGRERGHGRDLGLHHGALRVAVLRA